MHKREGVKKFYIGQSAGKHRIGETPTTIAIKQVRMQVIGILKWWAPYSQYKMIMDEDIVYSRVRKTVEQSSTRCSDLNNYFPI